MEKKSKAIIIIIICIFGYCDIYASQINKIRISNNDLFLERNGNKFQLTNDQKEKDNIKISNDGSKIIFSYKKKRNEKDTKIVTCDLNKQNSLSIYRAYHEIKKMDWINNFEFYVLGNFERGSELFTIYKIGNKQIFREFWGRCFSLSPNKDKLAYLNIIGAHEFNPDKIFIDSVDNSDSANVSPAEIKGDNLDVDNQFKVISDIAWLDDDDVVYVYSFEKKSYVYKVKFTTDNDVQHFTAYNIKLKNDFRYINTMEIVNNQLNLYGHISVGIKIIMKRENIAIF